MKSYTSEWLAAPRATPAESCWRLGNRAPAFQSLLGLWDVTGAKRKVSSPVSNYGPISEIPRWIYRHSRREMYTWSVESKRRQDERNRVQQFKGICIIHVNRKEKMETLLVSGPKPEYPSNNAILTRTPETQS